MNREARNLAVVHGLHPKIQPAALIILAWGDEHGMKILFTEGYRSFSRQAALYAQGRTTDGPRVTNARPGYSYHGYGLAIDLLDLAASGVKDAYEPSDYEHTNYQLIKAFAATLGFEWGGIWRNNPDRPHIE